VFKAFSLSIDLFSNIFFWFMFAMTGWWFVFYKLQERVYCLMPALDSYAENYHPYDAMLISLVVLKFISIAKKIVLDQSSMDVFMIDWEMPKMQAYKRHAPKQSVNPWRRLMVCNEMNELQQEKTISTEMVLFLFLVISEGFGYKYWASMQPTLSND